MAMNDRTRRKHAKAAQKLVPDATVTGYAIGRSGANPVIVVLAMLGTSVAFSILLLLATGRFVLIGLLPMLIVQHFLSPPRAVVIADQGVALASRSLMTGKATKLVSVMGHGYVQPVEESLGRVKVGVGHETVWMAKKEEAVLRAAVTQHAAAIPSAGPVPPMPFSG
ncbi:MAG TPA: hypothetical protein VNS19_13740 [Acidimicrobiales bacterium]|jgi:hypothetical protein|nr:hypothetical protein [Acidimicrobiales bacterium]